MRFRMLPAATALVAVALLVGCVPQDPVITPVPEPSSSPVFASDEEALAAATEAYGRYLRKVDEGLITHSSLGLETVAAGDALEQAKARIHEYIDLGERHVGRISIASISLATAEAVLGSNHRGEPIQIYACLDLSAVDVVDSAEKSVVDSERPASVFLLVDLTWDTDTSAFKVLNEQVWDGANADC
jgi:hypothetical protein